MKIKKLQGGGVAPFMTYTPNVATADVAQTALAPQQALAKEEKKKGLLDDSMIKLLMSEGIPSDVQLFMSTILEMSFGLSEGLDMTLMYNLILPLLNKIKFNKDQLIKTRDNLYANGGLNEIAITTNGGVVTMGEDGKMKIISIDELSANPNLHLLTNNDLEKLRAYDTGAAFNNNIVGIMQNGQGAEAVTKELQGVISLMKTQKEQKNGFMPAEQMEALKGIDALSGIAEYKIDKESSRVYKEHAKGYLFNMLSQNSRNLLRAKAAQKGMDPNKGALDLIETLIIPSTMEGIKEEIDLKGVDGAGGAGGSSSSATRQLTWLDQYVGNSMGTDQGGRMHTHEFNLGDNYSIAAPAIKINLFLTPDGKPLDTNNPTIGTIINKSLVNIGKADQVYFGNERISPDKLDNIVATGANATKVYMPLDQKALARGEYKPDLMVSAQMKEAEREIKKKGATTESQKAQIYREYGIELYFTTNPIANTNLFAPFAAIPAWAQGEGVIKNPDMAYLKEVDSDDDDIRRLLNEGKLGKSQAAQGKDYLKGFWNFLSDTDIYQGIAFVHTPDDVQSAAAAGSNLTVPKLYGDYESVMLRQAEALRQEDYKKLQTGTNLLK